MGKINILKKIITTIAIAIWFSGGVFSCKGNNSIIIVEGPTKLLLEPECSFYKGAKLLTLLDKGEKAQIIDVKYLKDCMVYQIKLTDGRIGYITHGDDFKVVGGR